MAGTSPILVVSLLVVGLCLVIPSVGGSKGVSKGGTRAPALSPTISPLVFVPGKAGNQLEAKLDKSFSEHDHCPKKKDWYRIWMDVWQMLPVCYSAGTMVPAVTHTLNLLAGDIECWSENLYLHYNSTTGECYNTPGVDIRVPGWGTTESVEYVDPSWTAWAMGNVGSYAAKFIRELVKFGYKRGEDLHAAPYDFRLAPASQPEYHTNLKHLIEETYQHNDNSPVVLVGHSNGGLMALYFLNSQSKQWKEKHIKSYVSVNTPYGGTPLITLMYTSGYNWGIEAVDTLIIREQQRSYQTSALLLPRAPVFDDDWVLIQTPDKNYTANDYGEYFGDLNYTLGKRIWSDVLDPFLPKLVHPEVDSHCFLSNGRDTIGTLIYGEGEFPDKLPSKFTIVDGDSTVPMPSLRSCADVLRHADKRYSLQVTEIDDEDHVELMYSQQFLKHLKQIVTLGKVGKNKQLKFPY